MKLKLKLTLTLATLGVVLSGAEAGLINGNITFQGGIHQFRQTGGSDTQDLSIAVGVNDFASVAVQSVDGDFGTGGVAAGQAVIFVEPYIFDPSTVTTGLWSVGGFTFDLSSSTILFQNATALVVTGLGTVTGPTGYDVTPGTFAFSTQDTKAAGQFSFSASSEVPDGGATLALFGLSLLGLQGVRRKLRK